MPSPPAAPLPDNLRARYHAWHGGQFQAHKAKYARLAQAQHPQGMVISCCDSRVNAMSLFAGQDGDFFIHRNIANLVPPYAMAADHHGTAAAIEYAVKALNVAYILVLGHAGCGGIAAGFAQHKRAATGETGTADTARAAAGKNDMPFISTWLSLLTPAFARLPSEAQQQGDANALTQLEKISVAVSLANLASYPFIEEAMTEGQLKLCGLWHDIGSGQLFVYDSQTAEFHPA